MGEVCRSAGVRECGSRGSRLKRADGLEERHFEERGLEREDVLEPWES